MNLKSKITPLQLLAASLVLAGSLCSNAYASAVSFDAIWHFKEVRNTLPLGGLLKLVQVGGWVSPSAGTTVSAVNTVTNEMIAVPFFPTPSQPDQFDAFLPINQNQMNGQWVLTATNGGMDTVAVTNVVGQEPADLPFVLDLAISDGPTPTVSWTLPDLTGVPVSRLRVRILDEQGLVLSTSASFNPFVTTSFVVSNPLNAGNYYARVMLETLVPGGLQNRSSTIEAFTVVPVPAALPLLVSALGLAGFGIRKRRK
jgi:hypothetical protein